MRTGSIRERRFTCVICERVFPFHKANVYWSPALLANKISGICKACSKQKNWKMHRKPLQFKTITLEGDSDTFHVMQMPVIPSDECE